MKAPQIILIVSDVILLFLAAYQHGKMVEVRINFWEILSRVAVGIALLWWGGFFQ